MKIWYSRRSFSRVGKKINSVVLSEVRDITEAEKIL